MTGAKGQDGTHRPVLTPTWIVPSHYREITFTAAQRAAARRIGAERRALHAAASSSSLKGDDA